MELIDYTATPISGLKDRFTEARFDPTMMIKASIETVEAITKGEAMLVDASNPFVLGLEMSAVQAAVAVQENIASLRRQYPALATTPDELYLHMSDEDFLDRFASPSAPSKFIFCFLYEDLVTKSVYDETENAWKLIIPRDTKIEVDSISFATLYPIVIRRFSTGALQISVDVEKQNPLMPPKNVILDPVIRTGTEQDKWVFFSVDMLQVRVVDEYAVIDKTVPFKKSIVFQDSFCYARVHYKNQNTNGKWIEIKTTHTDQVFDPTSPTAVLKVENQLLTVSIPILYTINGMLSGEIRIDTYTTLGQVSHDLGAYRRDAFVVTFQAFDDVNDLNAYTQAMADVSFYAYSLDITSGGKSEIPFNELREMAIYNAIGPQQIPITNLQVVARGDKNSFDVVPNVDVLTNRIFLATSNLPVPSQPKLVTPANIGIVTANLSQAELSLNENVILNGSRQTLRSNTMLLNENGITRLVGKLELQDLQMRGQTAMVNHINSSQYLYTPFYNVLDESGEEFELRVYSLDQPYAKDQNFIRQNQTLQLFVNTYAYELKKVENGFEFLIVTKSGGNYKLLEDNQVGVQLAFHPKGESAYAYINGTKMTSLDSGERVYRFFLETNYDLNSDNLICITNSEVEGITDYKAWIDLETEFNLLHYTTSLTESYRADETSLLIGKFMLPAQAAGNVHEKITLHFGDALKNLWRRSRSYLQGPVYQTYYDDLPLYHEEDVFQKDPDTGASFTVEDGQLIYLYLARKGDPVYDLDGNPVYQHRAGDIIYRDGEPVIDKEQSVYRSLDLLVVDGRYLFSDDVATVSYRAEIQRTLTDWITKDVSGLQSNMLEKTSIFFYPKTTLGVIEVTTQDGESDSLQAEQSFTVQLYVPDSIHRDESLRATLKENTIRLLDEEIENRVINMTVIKEKLRAIYGDNVTAFSIKGLGGSKDYQYVKIVSEKNRLCLKKQLVIQPDKTMFVEDAVTVEFMLVA